jgi:hypothetical protein
MYPVQLIHIIQVRCYCAHEVSNVDETRLHWKQMPARTFTATKERLLKDTNQQRQAHLACRKQGSSMCSAARPNFKAWVMGAIFQDRVCCEFLPAVKAHLLKNKLVFECLLLVDSAPGDSQCIYDQFSKIKVVFLPPNTTSLLQLMDQNLTVTFKHLYAQCTMIHIIFVTGNETGPDLKEF